MYLAPLDECRSLGVLTGENLMNAALANTVVLVADDDRLILSVARIVLMEAGARVLVCNDGVEAVERFAESIAEIDAVVLDYSMPGCNGLEALQQMREMKPLITGVIVGGLDPTPELAEVIDAGKVVFVPKPFRGPELLEALHQARGGNGIETLGKG